jgi:hypothetical protein
MPKEVNISHKQSIQIIFTGIDSQPSGNQVQDPSRQQLCTRDLICWSFQISRGMEYLQNRKVGYDVRLPRLK